MRRLRVTETHDYDIIGTLLPPDESAVRFTAAPPSLIGIAPAAGIPAR
jgi:hypothetical protein